MYSLAMIKNMSRISPVGGLMPVGATRAILLMLCGD